MKEIWKDIDGYIGHYQISNLGNVKSLTRIITGNRSPQLIKEKILKSANNNYGYLTVSLRLNGIGKNHTIHRLVAKAFLNNENHVNDVNHIDGNRMNNCLNNLEWVSRRENLSHGVQRRCTTSKYNGVHYNSRESKWKSILYHNKKHIFLGLFDDEYHAHLAYLKACKKYNINNKYIKK